MPHHIKSWAWVSPSDVRRGVLPKAHWWVAADKKTLAQLFQHTRQLSNWEGWKIALRLNNGQVVTVRQRECE